MNLPTNRPSLLHFLSTQLNLHLPSTSVCPNHNSPLDYLAHSFFEPATDLVVWAPRGGGKTTLGAAATLLDLFFKPTCQIRILGGSLQQSLRMWDTLAPWLQQLAPHASLRKRRSMLIKLENGSAASVLAQSERAVRGLRVQKLRCDEVELFKPEIWEAAQLVTRSVKSSGHSLTRGTIEAFSTLHRPHGLMRKIIDNARDAGKPVIHWCILDILERCPSERQCEHCMLLSDCNKVAKTRCDGHLSIDDAIAMKHRVSRETWESEMLCKCPSTRNCVFPNFSEHIHIRESIPLALPSAMLWLGIDFGFQNPFVCLWIRVGENGLVHVIDEYIQEHKQIQEHIDAIKARPHGAVFRVACDPAGKSRNDQTSKSNVQRLREAGFVVRTRGSAILDGVEEIRAALAPAAGEPTLFIHPRCRRLIEALAGYRYSEEDNEVPLKDGRHDHLTDALRYFYVNRVTGDVKGGKY